MVYGNYRLKMTALILSFVLLVSSALPFLSATPASAEENTALQSLRVLDVETDPNDGIKHDKVTLTWDLMDGITPDDGYNVYFGGGGYIRWIAGPPVEVGGLQPETEYSFYISPGKTGLKSNVVTITTEAADPNSIPKAPLLPPHNLRITDVTETGLTLNWDGSPEANGYDVYINGDWKAGVWDGSNSFTFPVAEATVTGAVYSFAVAAQKLPDKSGLSNAVTLTWGQLEAPRDVQVVTATKTTVALGWAPSPGATSYEVYRDGVLAGTSASNRFVAAGLTEGQTYAFKVVAKNKLWTSPDSASVSVKPGSRYNIITYYTSWSVYERNFMPEDIDVAQLTHINYAFSDLCWNGFSSGGRPCTVDSIKLQKEYVHNGEMIIGDAEVDIGNFAKLNARKTENPNLKLLVSVGGWSWSDHFSRVAMEEQTRRAFANSVVDFLREYDLDGIDVDWEYPVEGGEESNSRSPLDRENFTLLMKVVREALDAAGSVDGKYYLLTIASSQSDAFVVNADLARSTAYLDFINIMTYDYAGDWEQLAHHNAPLYYDKNHPKVSGPRLNVAGGVAGHLNGGVPSYKLVLGVPFYGPGWLNCPPPGQFQACAGGSVPPGETFGTYEPFTFDYTDLEENYIDKNGYVKHWNDAAKVPYLYNEEKQRFISYDDAESLLYKAALVRTLDLAGTMSWDISSDRNRTLTTALVRELPIDGATAASGLAAPANLKALSAGTTSATIAWDASAGASGYDIFADRAWLGYTTDTSFRLTGLASRTGYDVQVVAVAKDDGRATAVSPGSFLRLTTASPSSGGGGGGGGGAPEPDTSGIGDPAANRLKPTTKLEGGKATVSLNTEDAVKSIKEAKSAKTQIIVVTDAAAVETVIAKEILQAIADRGASGILSLIVNGVEFSLPIQALKLGEGVASVRITIQPPDQAAADAFRAAAKSNGAQVLAGPLDFKVEALSSGNAASALDDFGPVYVSRFFELNAEAQVDPALATGVLYDPDKQSYRHVPTLFIVHEDGSASAELKRPGNSIYAIVQSAPSFLDWNVAWAREDIRQAAAKGIAFGDNARVFGAKRDITRGELVAIIVNGLGISPGSHSSPFKDVDANTPFAPEIIAAWKLGIINGKSADRFDPEGLITRQELSAVLEQAMAFAGAENAASESALAPFADRSSIAPYARSSMALMVEQRILNGVSATKLAPQGTVTKAQATVSVMRMLRALKLTD
ncbi:chitinase [Cohnella sp. SGD-V74]|uniref:glycosyl hydrolase family 18 protein n=1 Tax=unclassified Cohnella TaxID=2636738 RepID=UPI000D4DC3BF|nr:MULTISPECIES: glycosyl hydrolase family 18 protein [unclassified Cohnella]PRX73981.1 chitinase [Cohnella sp. SGD-V74]